MASKFKNNSLIGNRIREQRERLNLTRPALAKAVDVSLSALQGWELNEREPQASIIISIANELGVTPNYLLTGEISQSSSMVEKAFKCLDSVAKENISMIMSYSTINVSAGFGSFNEEITMPDGEEPYSNHLLERLGVKPNRCAVFWANGNSMEPVIKNGDQLLVDLTKNQICENSKIYLIQNEDSVWVKRVKILWDRVELISDNKAEYEPIIIPKKEAHNLCIIGQVVHIGHSLV